MKREMLIKFRGQRSQSDMAKNYGVSQQAWSKWENGISLPKIATMKQIELDSGIPMECFFGCFYNPKF